MKDLKTDANQTCYGQFCTYWKYDQAGVPVVIQGCYNWTASAVKSPGCYKMLDQPNSDMKNGLICICNQSLCNNDQLSNAVPNTAKTFTCQSSASNATCQGYACITKYITKVAQNSTTTVERKCQKNFHYIDWFEFNEIIQDAQQTFCVTDTAYDARIASNEVECYCYANDCNAPGNDANLPKLSFMYNECKSEVCSADGCRNLDPSGVCKGQFCYSGIVTRHYWINGDVAKAIIMK